MLLTNYHTHCEYCDGAGMPEDYIEVALEKGFDALGFSSHAPIPFEKDWTVSEEELPDYLDLIDRLKEKYKDRIEVYKGLEIDYLKGISGPSSEKFASLKLDYAIGSVHMMPVRNSDKFLAIDGPVKDLQELLKNTYDGSMELLSKGYFQLMQEMLQNHKFDILGHFDLMKKRNKNNLLFDEESPWYRNHVIETLDTLAGTDVILEVNTGGLSRGATDTIYPSPWILKAAQEKNIPLMLNADAHNKKHIDFYYREALSIIKECGYRELYSLYGGKWVTSTIEL